MPKNPVWMACVGFQGKVFFSPTFLSLNMHNTPHGQNICIHLSIEQPTMWREVQVFHKGFVDFEKGLR